MESTTPKGVGEELLTLRKEYKKVAVSLQKAKSHAGLISSCKDRGQTPKGLRINVGCSAFLADVTNVKVKFAETTRQAEQGYVSHLGDHYNGISEELEEKQTLLKGAMISLQTRATMQ